MSKDQIDNFYELTGLEPSVPIEAIIKENRHFLRRYHPDKDRNLTDEEREKYDKIVIAFRILTDEISKSLYDSFGDVYARRLKKNHNDTVATNREFKNPLQKKLILSLKTFFT
jgi:DnaJ-class molecular chaperone